MGFDLRDRKTPLSSRHLAAGIWALAVAVAGCSVKLPEHKPNEEVQRAADIAANTEQIRVRARSLVGPLTGFIVDAANEILAKSDDIDARRAALLWKIQAVPALREALFQPNALTALIDAWELSWQMLDYFQTGAGKDAFGGSQAVALDACQRLESEINAVAVSLTISKDVGRAREVGRKWASEHPIRGSILGRTTTMSSQTKLDIETTLSTSEVLGNLTVSVDDLNRRLAILSAQLPDESRWQAELFALDLERAHGLSRAVPLAERAVETASRASEEVRGLRAGLDRVAVVVESAPALIARERESALREVAAELTRALTFVQSERTAAVKDVRETVVEQRKAVTQDLEPLLVRVVDHAFERALPVLLAAGGVAFVAVLVAALILRRRPNAP